jgi:hypothetical protein
MAVLLFWTRREHDYTVEQRSGAGEVALQLRQQFVIFAAVTVPIAAGFLLVDVLARSTGPMPWPPFGGPLALATIIAVHAAVSAGTAVRVHRLYSRAAQE